MKRKRSPFGCLFPLIFVLIMGIGGVYGYRKYMPTKELVNLDEFYDAGGEDRVVLFLNYERQEDTGIYRNGQTYVPVSWVNACLNERFYWDSQEEILVYALPEEIVTADLSTAGGSGQPIMIEEGEDVYLSLGLVLNYTDIRMNVFDSGEQKRVYVENNWDAVPMATISSNGKVRVRGGLKSPILTDAVKGESVIVLETLDNWSRVATQDGHVGYMLNWRLTDRREEIPQSTFEAPVYKNISLDEKIVMVWHQVTVDAANSALDELLGATKGVNVVAPTWFTLSDNQGNYESLASKSYVDKAHEMGIQVWAVLDNFSRECSKNVQTEKLLSRTSVRRSLIDSLMEEADTYGFDGINLDFESLKEEAGVHYVQFIRELSVSCRKKGLVLSVDNYVPAAYNRFYNRKEQGTVADYVIIMGYDEHYAGGEPGAVASLSYVEKGIRDTLELVPREKVINGVPFYTRLWTETDDGVSSKALGIAAAKQWIDENGVELSWDDTLGQYYGELENSEGRSMLWMEDERSLELKMNAVKEYDLAGVSGWKLGLESPEVWDVIGWN